MGEETKLSRREVLAIGGLTLAASASAALPTEAQRGSITDVPGIKVGHFTDKRRPTGCTVILTEEGATAGVDVRGASPGTRETDLLSPVNTVEKVHAVLLAGGSAFGLDAATGVVRYLEERGVGFQTSAARVPIVPAAILYDLAVGDAKIRPDAEAGYRACKAATAEAPAEGNAGAGAGATLGKLFGMERAMKGGLGTASIKLLGGVTIGALVAVNAMGDVLDPATNKIIAGARTADGRALVNTMASILGGAPLPPLLGGTATTLGIVATDTALTKVQAAKVAQMAHDGLARTINPIHTAYDGDTIFALSTAKNAKDAKEANVTLIGALAAEAVARAVVRAVRAARGVAGFPSAADL